MNKNSAEITNKKIVSMVLVSQTDLDAFNSRLDNIANSGKDYVPVGGICVTSTYCHTDKYIVNSYSQLFVEYVK